MGALLWTTAWSPIDPSSGFKSINSRFRQFLSRWSACIRGRPRRLAPVAGRSCSARVDHKRAIRRWLRCSASGSRTSFYLCCLSWICYADGAQWLGRRRSRARWHFSPRSSDDGRCTSVLGFPALTRELPISNPRHQRSCCRSSSCRLLQSCLDECDFQASRFQSRPPLFWLLAFWRLPPWLVVVLTAVGGEV